MSGEWFMIDQEEFQMMRDEFGGELADFYLAVALATNDTYTFRGTWSELSQCVGRSLKVTKRLMQRAMEKQMLGYTVHDVCAASSPLEVFLLFDIGDHQHAVPYEDQLEFDYERMIDQMRDEIQRLNSEIRKDYAFMQSLLGVDDMDDFMQRVEKWWSEQ